MRFWVVLILCGFLFFESGSCQNVSSILSKSMFEEFLKHRNDGICPAKGFYTYEAFIEAAKSFGGFGTTGDMNTRKREIAAFFGQTSQETTGGSDTARDGPYAWGYCFKEEVGSQEKYRGRGPIQLTHEYNYAQAGKAIKVDLIKNPDLITKDAVISFKSALWFWMTPQNLKPSAHDVITGKWRPSGADSAAGRVPGYGVITNIINGGVECGKGSNKRMEGRIGFYKRYCNYFKVSPGENLDCANQKSFGPQGNLEKP